MLCSTLYALDAALRDKDTSERRGSAALVSALAKLGAWPPMLAAMHSLLHARNSLQPHETAALLAGFSHLSWALGYPLPLGAERLRDLSEAAAGAPHVLRRAAELAGLAPVPAAVVSLDVGKVVVRRRAPLQQPFPGLGLACTLHCDCAAGNSDRLLCCVRAETSQNPLQVAVKIRGSNGKLGATIHCAAEVRVPPRKSAGSCVAERQIRAFRRAGASDCVLLAAVGAFSSQPPPDSFSSTTRETNPQVRSSAGFLAGHVRLSADLMTDEECARLTRLSSRAGGAGGTAGAHRVVSMLAHDAGPWDPARAIQKIAFTHEEMGVFLKAPPAPAAAEDEEAQAQAQQPQGAHAGVKAAMTHVLSMLHLVPILDLKKHAQGRQCDALTLGKDGNVAVYIYEVLKVRGQGSAARWVVPMLPPAARRA